jgi:hypothetical protein
MSGRWKSATYVPCPVNRRASSMRRIGWPTSRLGRLMEEGAVMVYGRPYTSILTHRGRQHTLLGRMISNASPKLVHRPACSEKAEERQHENVAGCHRPSVAWPRRAAVRDTRRETPKQRSLAGDRGRPA